jgi:hypothetical protein
MKRERIDSTALVSVGYDAATNELEIEFAGGDVYRYYAVPARVAAALREADSPGRFVNQQIKPRYRAVEMY